MIDYKTAKEKAKNYYKDCEIIAEDEDDTYYRFAFGLSGEPLPGLDEVLINKQNGELSLYNTFTQFQKKNQNHKIKPVEL